jgi:cytochrome c-type biogenesis protein CcmH/NrfG
VCAGEFILAIGLAVAVGIIVLFVYWPVLGAQAICFDDPEYLVDNPLVRQPGWTSVGRFFREVLKPSTVQGYYQPLAMTSLMLDYAAGGRPDSLRKFHLTSLILHAANTALVVLLVFVLFGRAWPAAMVGLLFGLHPLAVEPVAWVSERKTLLCTFFSLAGLIQYVGYVRYGGLWRYVGCLTALVLSLLSKPTSIPLPVAMLLMDFWPLNRLSAKAALEKIPLFAVVAIFCVITLISQGSTVGVEVPDKQPFMRAVLLVCHNCVFYLSKVIWPVHLSSYYPFPRSLGWADPSVRAGVIGVCVLLPAVVVSLRWTRGAAVAVLVFLVMLLPATGIIGFAHAIAADRFVYLPACGLLMGLGWLLTRWWTAASRSSEPVAARAGLAVGVLLLVVAASVVTRQHIADYRDTESLYRRMVQLSPSSARLHTLLGAFLHERGRFDEAIEEHQLAHELDPGLAEVHTNMGLALIAQDRLEEAIACCTESLQLGPNSPAAYNNRAIAYARQQDYGAAAADWSRAIELRPNNPRPYQNRAMAYCLMGQREKARADLAAIERLGVTPSPQLVAAMEEAGNHLGP